VFGFGEKVGILTGGDPATTLVPLSNQVATAFVERVVQATEEVQRFGGQNLVVALAIRPNTRMASWSSTSFLQG
jgi:hypothetical protein